MVRDKTRPKNNLSNGRDKPASNDHLISQSFHMRPYGAVVNILLPALLRGTVRRNEFAPQES